jgi:hypothetical protein
MSGDLDMASGMVDFRLVDPPRVSPRPVSPNRLVLLSVALVFAIAAGLSSSLFASRLRPVFDDAQVLRVKSGMPVLGVVSMLLSDEKRQTERLDRLRFFGATGGFLALFLVALVTVSILASKQLD